MNEFIKNRPRRFEQINQGSLHWYKVTGLQAHRGTGSEDEIIHFVRQTNALNALEMATKKLRGWKRHRNNASSTEITDDYEINELENLFETKVIIIPKEPNDFTGHADGVIRYYDNETVLINGYKPTDKREFQNRLTKELKNQGLRTIEIPYNPYDNGNYDMADGLYINYLQMDNFILLPTFEKKEDEKAYRQFEQLFSRQTIETIDSRDISVDGGVLNCITWNIKE